MRTSVRSFASSLVAAMGVTLLMAPSRIRADGRLAGHPLVGRRLKGLDEWSPSKQEKKPEEAPKEEPTRDTAKSEEKAGK